MPAVRDVAYLMTGRPISYHSSCLAPLSLALSVVTLPGRLMRKMCRNYVLPFNFSHFLTTHLKYFVPHILIITIGRNLLWNVFDHEIYCEGIKRPRKILELTVGALIQMIRFLQILQWLLKLLNNKFSTHSSERNGSSYEIPPSACRHGILTHMGFMLLSVCKWW